MPPWKCHRIDTAILGNLHACRMPIPAPPPASSAPVWCEDELVLASMYSFTHLSCSQLQAEGYAMSMAGLFSRFTQDVVAHGPSDVGGHSDKPNPEKPLFGTLGDKLGHLMSIAISACDTSPVGTCMLPLVNVIWC